MHCIDTRVPAAGTTERREPTFVPASARPSLVRIPRPVLRRRQQCHKWDDTPGVFHRIVPLVSLLHKVPCIRNWTMH